MSNVKSTTLPFVAQKAALSYGRVVAKVNHKHKNQNRVLVLSRMCLALLDMERKVRRAVAYAELKQVYLKRPAKGPIEMLLKVEGEHDILVRFIPHPGNRKEVEGEKTWDDALRCVRLIEKHYKDDVEDDILVTIDESGTTTGDLKTMANLTKPANYRPVRDKVRHIADDAKKRRREQLARKRAEAERERQLLEQQAQEAMAARSVPVPHPEEAHLPSVPQLAPYASGGAAPGMEYAAPHMAAQEPPTQFFPVPLSGKDEVLGLEFAELQDGSAVIESTVPGGLCHSAGVPTGRVVSLNGIPINRENPMQDVFKHIVTSGAGECVFEIEPIDDAFLQTLRDVRKADNRVRYLRSEEAKLDLWEWDIENRKRALQDIEAAESAAAMRPADVIDELFDRLPDIPESQHPPPSTPSAVGSRVPHAALPSPARSPPMVAPSASTPPPTITRDGGVRVDLASSPQVFLHYYI